MEKVKKKTEKRKRVDGLSWKEWTDVRRIFSAETEGPQGRYVPAGSGEEDGRTGRHLEEPGLVFFQGPQFQFYAEQLRITWGPGAGGGGGSPLFSSDTLSLNGPRVLLYRVQSRSPGQLLEIETVVMTCAVVGWTTYCRRPALKGAAGLRER